MAGAGGGVVVLNHSGPKFTTLHTTSMSCLVYVWLFVWGLRARGDGVGVWGGWVVLDQPGPKSTTLHTTSMSCRLFMC